MGTGPIPHRRRSQGESDFRNRSAMLVSFESPTDGVVGEGPRVLTFDRASLAPADRPVLFEPAVIVADAAAHIEVAADTLELVLRMARQSAAEPDIEMALDALHLAFVACTTSAVCLFAEDACP